MSTSFIVFLGVIGPASWAVVGTAAFRCVGSTGRPRAAVERSIRRPLGNQLKTVGSTANRSIKRPGQAKSACRLGLSKVSSNVQLRPKLSHAEIVVNKN
ncbi:hypothetical protein ACX0MV_04855 [Pseudomonas borbori]